MSKTRINKPNNTASRIAPRMVHVSKVYVPVNDPITGLLHHHLPLEGVTFNAGKNAQKRISRRASIKARLAARRAT